MDSTRFKEIFLPQSRRMYLMALRLTGNAADAEDAVQETLARLWQMRHSLHEVARHDAYAMTLLHNHCLDMLRRRRDNAPESAAADSTAPSPDPSDAIAERDRVSLVLRLMEHLPDNQRMVMMMRDVEGCEISEIQQATGLSAGNIRVILSRARAAIRQHFSQQ